MGSSKPVGLENNCKYCNQSRSRVVGAQRSEWIIAELNFLGALTSHLILSPWRANSFPRLHLSLMTHMALFLSEPCLPMFWPMTTYLAPLCANATDTHNTTSPKYISHHQPQIFNSYWSLSTHWHQKPRGHPWCSLLTSLLHTFSSSPAPLQCCVKSTLT